MKSFFVFFLFFLGRFVFAQNEITPKNNFEVLRNLYSEVSTEICAIIPAEVKNINIQITGDENNFIVENFLREGIVNKCNLNISSESSQSSLEIIQNTKIQYLNISGSDDKFVRDFNCLISARLNRMGIIKTKSFEKKYCDTLIISDLQIVDHTKIRVNKERLVTKNILEILFQPVIILAGLGVFVYLLFSIRSN
jgi:hypothetical protein